MLLYSVPKLETEWIRPSCDEDLDAASAAWDIVFQYHGRPSGIFAADEYLAGLEAARGYAVFRVSTSSCLTYLFDSARNFAL